MSPADSIPFSKIKVRGNMFSTKNSKREKIDFDKYNGKDKLKKNFPMTVNHKKESEIRFPEDHDLEKGVVKP